VTSNGLTMQPIIAWYREVLGFEPFWEISFHRRTWRRSRERVGARSIVMWTGERREVRDERALRPFYRDSQITSSSRTTLGNGVQHIAFAVTNILCRSRDAAPRVEFLKTHPRTTASPRAPGQARITNVKEELRELERLQNLGDGANDKYMLQIFMRERPRCTTTTARGRSSTRSSSGPAIPASATATSAPLFESIERAQRGTKS